MITIKRNEKVEKIVWIISVVFSIICVLWIMIGMANIFLNMEWFNYLMSTKWGLGAFISCAGMLMLNMIISHDDGVTELNSGFSEYLESQEHKMSNSNSNSFRSIERPHLKRTKSSYPKTSHRKHRKARK